MNRKHILNESDLNRIVEETVRDYITESNFGGWNMFKRNNTQELVEQNRVILLSVINRLIHNLNNEMTYLKYNGHFKDINPMYINNMPDGKEKEQTMVAQKIITKCAELYQMVMQLKSQI